MYLRDLCVCASDLAEIAADRTAADFNRSAHAAVEGYLDALPRRRVVLGNLAKVNLEVGPRPRGVKAYYEALGVAIVYYLRFDFARYLELSRKGRQRRIIELLHRTLIRIAARTHSESACFETARAKLLAMPFPLPELTELKLRRKWGLLRPPAKRRLRRTRRT